MASGSAGFGATQFGQFPASPAELRASTDADFLSGLNATVAVEYNVRSAAGTVDSHLGAPPKYEPIPGYDAIPCRVVLKRSGEAEGDARAGQVTRGRVLLGVALPADRRYRFAYAEPTRGIIHLYLTGPVIDAHEMGHHWYVDVQDRPL